MKHTLEIKMFFYVKRVVKIGFKETHFFSKLTLEFETLIYAMQWMAIKSVSSNEVIIVIYQDKTNACNLYKKVPLAYYKKNIAYIICLLRSNVAYLRIPWHL
jgi:hypothetical protein